MNSSFKTKKELNLLSKNFFPVFQKKLEPSLVKRGTHNLNFLLDQTEGNEIYYVIASNKKFDFEEAILLYLKQIFPKGSSKGMVLSPYYLPLPEHFLPEHFVQQHIYFQHLKRP